MISIWNDKDGPCVVKWDPGCGCCASHVLLHGTPEQVVRANNWEMDGVEYARPVEPAEMARRIEGVIEAKRDQIRTLQEYALSQGWNIGAAGESENLPTPAEQVRMAKEMGDA